MIRVKKIVQHLAFLSAVLFVCAGMVSPLQAAMPEEFMSIDEIRPGMVGVGKTVVQGYELSEFKAHILGVDRGAMAGSSLILVRLEAPFLEQHGVVAGMSGSPVYIDGRLIGAISYGWTFSYKPYGGITPIEDMWTVWENIGQNPEAVASTSGQLNTSQRSQAWDWNDAWLERSQSASDGASQNVKPYRPSHPAFSGIEGGMVPLQSPLFLSGAHPETLSHLDQIFGPELAASIFPLGASAGGAENALAHDGTPPPPLTGGASVAVPMLTGDLTMAGTGTVTYREGDRMIAFGHPMFNDGLIHAPMAHAYIFGFMQSYGRSFKLSSLRDTIGTVDQDRNFAIGGTLGPAPEMMPLSVAVEGSATFRPRDYHYECWREKGMLPRAMTVAALDSYMGSVGTGGDVTVKMAAKITLADGRTIESEDTVSGNGYVVSGPVMNIMRTVSLLYDNPFKAAEFDSIDIAFKADQGIRAHRLVGARSDHLVYRPGEKVTITMRCQEYMGEEYNKEYTLDLPEEIAPGNYVIHLAGASMAERIEAMHRPGLYRAYDFDDLVEGLQAASFPNDELRVYFFEPDLASDLDGATLRGMPGTMDSIVMQTASDKGFGQSIGKLLGMDTLGFDGTILGAESLAIEINPNL